MPCFARVFGVIVICSEITDCGELVQNGAYCYYLLVVKLVVKGDGLLLRILNTHIKLRNCLREFLQFCQCCKFFE